MEPAVYRRSLMLVGSQVILLFIALLLSAQTWGGSDREAVSWHTAPPFKPAVEVYFFWSIRCPHCLEARPFVEALPTRYPWVKLHSLELYNNPAHRQRFSEMAELVGISARSVPSFFWCGQAYSGWDREDTTGRWLLDALAECYRTAYGRFPPNYTPADTRQDSEMLDLPLFGAFDPQSLSLPTLTLLLAGLDAFNPCAFFVLLFLLSLLTHTRSRRRMLLVGGVFILFSGLIYFLFMAAWLNVFNLLGEIELVTLIAGLLAVTMALINIKDYFWFKQGVSLSIPEQQRGYLFARMRRLLGAESMTALLTGTVVLAVAANSYELLCTAGFPMVYTRILTLNELSTLGYYGYLALYNLVYVTPLLLIVLGFVFTMGRHKLSEQGGRLLKLLSGLLMLGLGLLLIIAPDMLANLLVAITLFAAAVLLTLVVRRVRP